MQKVALYRKYRPENFDDVVSQEHIVRVLKNAVSQSMISHAYIFSGPRGTGKTTLARILAKTINCEKRKDYNPCGKCSICVGIEEGRLLDLIEIDAASNRGIDEIRDLREKVKFSPTEGAYKVFIIDEVHMLTKEAFNALLKTLEEPPSHAIFILATTELNKVPQTILSRCQRHDFRRIKTADLMSRLELIKNEEKIEITPDALKSIAEASDGGLRDAISLLDQMSSIGLTKIEEPDVEAVLGLAPHEVVAGFVRALLTNDAKTAISILETSSSSGTDLILLAEGALDFLRKLLLVKLSGQESLEGTKEQADEFSELSQNTEKSKIVSLMDDFFSAQASFRYNVEPIMVLSVLCAKEAVTSKALEVNIAEPKQKAAPVNTGTPLKPNGKWQHVLMETKTKNNTIHAVLRVANPAFEGNILTLTFPYKFHKERIEEKKNKMIVEDVVRKVYGNDALEVRCDLESTEGRNHTVSNAKDAADLLGGEIVD